MTRTSIVVVLALLVPATARAQPATTPTPEPAEPDVDLSAYGGDPTKPDDHLTMSGFADVSWCKLAVPNDSPAANYFWKENSFLVGNVNVYLTKNLSSRWRSLLEVRYLFAPTIVGASGTLQTPVTPDPANDQRPISVGGISIQRVYLEYELNASLTIQAGSFLTPYGIWNVDHGSPVIIPVTKPYLIGENLFPEQQTGLHVYGKHAFGAYQLGYHATLTNGRGSLQAYRDLDENKSLGGRLELATPWLDGVKFGLSGYGGKYTDRPADVISTDAAGNLINTTPTGIRYMELAYGADVALHRGGLYMQAELIGNDRHYLPRARELASGGFLADSRYIGAYALAGYRFDRWWQVMPFAVLELENQRPDPVLGINPRIFGQTVGLNFRPDPSVVLKVQYTQEFLHASLLDFTVRAVITQAAWAF